MNLVASMMVGAGERDRYLGLTVPALLEFCDGVSIVSEETPETNRWLEGLGCRVLESEPGAFFAHEGQARNRLLDWTLADRPTHVLAIDADELVSDGHAVQRACAQPDGVGVWSLSMEEVWKADFQKLWVRMDGGWRSHPVPILFRAPKRSGGLWRIQDRALACGREPLAVRQVASRAKPCGAAICHFGWTNEAERQARYNRYAVADGGKFHASSHLKSILAPDARVRIARREWPAGLAGIKDELLERVNREAVAA